MSEELSTAYQPAGVESRWYQTWESRGLFAAHPNRGKEPFTIVIPPPNVTGALHMGHAFEHTLQDIYIRLARMRGYEALWLPGTDHAGIATQNVVERELAKEGLSRHDVGREAFVERVWQWKERYGGRISEQMRKLGDSCDWTRERFTMDEGLSRAVRTVFVRWFEDGLIYRGLRIINWCPRCGTALSDIEVEHEPVTGELITFRYELTDGSGSIPVATTRVETMLGDTGIAVHPDDDRYRDMIGKVARHPFFPDRELPIVADDAVDPDFGSGAVKVTPAHDATDFEIGERHGLEQINILDQTARTNENAGEFRGMDRYEARQVVLHRLRELGIVEKEESHEHAVGHCYRCGTEIEPWLSEQWFVRMEPLARPAIDAVRDGRISIHPRRFAKSYLDWMENIRDWCISRQIWWGHRIPIFYCDDCGETFAALEDPTECRKCSSKSLRQDPDVLDTWFSSQLWPFSTLGWPDQSEDLAYFYPTTLMAPGYEILFLWVARMITSGLYFMGDVPFREVFIHGIVRDFEGKKMAKSLGNVIDPVDMIERYGADALRFSLAFAAVPGNDTNISEDRIEGARNFANKLWNAARFVLLSVGSERPEVSGEADLGVEDRWILSRLDRTIAEIDSQFETFNVSEAMRALYRFTWSEFCDWHIELAKLHLDDERASSTKAVLVHALDRILRLLHPAMPFITEELWSRLRPDQEPIAISEWPRAEGRVDQGAEGLLVQLQEIVTVLRRLKTDHNIPQNKKLAVWGASANQQLDQVREQIMALARLEDITWRDDVIVTHGLRAITPSGIELVMDPGESLQIDVERERLNKEIAHAEAEIARAQSKLENEQFVKKAPPELVERERVKLAEWTVTRDKLLMQRDELGG